MFRVSLTNQMTNAARITLVGGTEQPAYPVANLRTPDRIGKPWRTTSTATQTALIDFGASGVCMDALAIIDANVGIVQALAHNGGGTLWGPQAVNVERNRWNGRWQTVMDGPAAPATYRYLQVTLPTQTPLDGAAYFSLGGLWVGTWSEAPRDVRWSYRVRPQRAVHDEQPEHGAWRERSRTGPTITLITCERQAILEGQITTDDQLAAWRSLDDAMAVAGIFLVQIEHRDPAQCWVARLLSTDVEWLADPWFPESSVELEEVVG